MARVRISIAGTVRETGNTSPKQYQAVSQGLEGTKSIRQIAFSDTLRVTRLVNDDTVEAHFGFGASPASKVGEADSTITQSGSGWSSASSTAASDGTYAITGTTSDTARIYPASSVSAIGPLYLSAAHGAILDVALSTDGTSWSSPSAVAGVVRSDGQTGTNMDTIDSYSTSLTAEMLLYTMPYPSTWRLRLTNTGSNASVAASPYNMFLDGAVWEKAGAAFVVKAGESLEVNANTTVVYHFAPSGTASVRVLAE